MAYCEAIALLTFLRQPCAFNSVDVAGGKLLLWQLGQELPATARVVLLQPQRCIHVVNLIDDRSSIETWQNQAYGFCEFLCRPTERIRGADVSTVDVINVTC